MKERNKTVEEIVSELGIIREQLRHPNVVRYHQTQTEGTLWLRLRLCLSLCPHASRSLSLSHARPLLPSTRALRLSGTLIALVHVDHTRSYDRDVSLGNWWLSLINSHTVISSAQSSQYSYYVSINQFNPITRELSASSILCNMHNTSYHLKLISHTSCLRNVRHYQALLR